MVCLLRKILQAALDAGGEVSHSRGPVRATALEKVANSAA
jgi:hypothetical protein